MTGKKVCIYTGPAWEKWDIESPYKTGIGGSEYCAGQLAKEMARQGHTVSMYGEHPVAEQYNVSLKHWSEYEQDQEYFDLLVASRKLTSLVHAKAKVIVVWAHDAWLLDGKELDQTLLDKVTRFVCLSPWHQDFFSQYHGISKDRITIIPNGMDTSMLSFDPDKKVFGKLHYSSCPDRGLENIVHLLPFIKDQVPELHLDVYYGFQNWLNAVKSRNNPRELLKLEKLLVDLEVCKDFINYKYRVNLSQLHEAWGKAYTWFYPTLFTESYCITAKEAQYSGTPIVCSDVAALKTTVGQFGMQVPFPYSKSGRQEAVNEIVRLHKDKDYWIQRSKQSLAGAQGSSWDIIYKEHWSAFL